MKQNRLYVGNVPYTTTEDELQATFAACGSLREVKIITDCETGRPGGFAFVAFETSEDAETATPAPSSMARNSRVDARS